MLMRIFFLRHFKETRVLQWCCEGPQEQILSPFDPRKLPFGLNYTLLSHR